MANTAGMEQRSKYQNELTKIGDFSNEPNQRQGVSGGTTALSTGTPSAAQDPLIDTESDDDVSSSCCYKKWLLSTIPLITPGCGWMTWFHIMYFLIVQTNKYITN